MYCRYCGRQIKEGEICECQKPQNQQRLQNPQRPQNSQDPNNPRWNVFMILSLIFSFMSIICFVVLRILLADFVGTGEIAERLIYVIPGMCGILACLMAVFSFKDRRLWKKSLVIFILGALLSGIFSVLLVVFSDQDGNLAVEEMTDEEELKSQEPTEDQRETEEFQTAELKVSDSDEEKASEIAGIKEKYEKGELDYAEIKQAIAEISVDDLKGSDVDVYLELQEKAEKDLTDTVERYVKAENYKEAYSLLNDIRERMPEDKIAESLSEFYAPDCILYLQSKSKALMAEKKEKKARKLLDEAKTYYPDESMIDNLLESLEDSPETTPSARLVEDYIIPDSDSRYLTEEDVKDLSLKEINYAKNEIYARRSRKFDSKELQDYFNTKPWYKGKINPDDFKISVFNSYEKKNAEFLNKIEFERDSKGYILDKEN